MASWRGLATVVALVCLAGAALAADPAKLIDIDDVNLFWSSYSSRTDTCVLAGKAVSEMRNDAFEVQFRHSRGQTLRLFVLIPGLPRGGSVFIESPTTRDRWKISTDNYVPALTGERAEALRRNVAAGIPIEFTFEYGNQVRTRYETAPHRAIMAATQFSGCIDRLAHQVPEAKK
jgi:hypothetical protein